MVEDAAKLDAASTYCRWRLKRFKLAHSPRPPAPISPTSLLLLETIVNMVAEVLLLSLQFQEVAEVAEVLFLSFQFQEYSSLWAELPLVWAEVSVEAVKSSLDREV